MKDVQVTAGIVKKKSRKPSISILDTESRSAHDQELRISEPGEADGMDR